jgi:hypothetical protein
VHVYNWVSNVFLPVVAKIPPPLVRPGLLVLCVLLGRYFYQLTMIYILLKTSVVMLFNGIIFMLYNILYRSN